jgi:hypothetical protein
LFVFDLWLLLLLLVMMCRSSRVTF